MDPFIDSGESAYFDADAGPVEDAAVGSTTAFLLPLGIALWVYFGAFLPWIVIRPFNGQRRTYNLTDVPGGIGILATSMILTFVGCLFSAWKVRVGTTIMGISLSAIGWMATISGLLLGVVGSLIPSINVAGIDLADSQVGQGPGVAVTVCAALLLGILVLRRYEPISALSPSVGIRMIPVIAILMLLLIGVNHHASWLVLGNPGADWVVEVPGDSMYGSGLILLAIYLCLGIWFLALAIKVRALTIFAAVLSSLVALTCLVYSVLVWIGGKAVAWLLPGKIDNLASVSTEVPLYLSFVGSALLLVLAILSFIPSVASWSLKLGSSSRQSASGQPDLVAGLGLIGAFTVATVIAVVL